MANKKTDTKMLCGLAKAIDGVVDSGKGKRNL